MAAAVEVEEESEEQDCPKCPPVGAPAWMATFADMATLLMAFFVLILSFAEFNTPKFKQISGSLNNAFGVQRIVPVVEQRQGQGGQQANSGEQATAGQAMSADQLASALKDAIQSGEVQVDMAGENVVINFPSQDTTQKDLPSLIQETLTALAEARQASGQADQEVLFGGLEQQLAQLATAAQSAGDAQGFSPTASDASAQAQA